MLSQILLSIVMKSKGIDINNVTHIKMPPKRNSVSPHKPQTARREMTHVEKGMIIAFFQIFEKISVVANLVNRS